MTDNVGYTIVSTIDFGACLSERVELVMVSASEFDLAVTNHQ